MSIPPRFLNDLRDRLTLSEVIGRRMKLTRAGREYKGCCPFHGEKTPSFTVNDDKQFYHCFGCGAHGDVIGFVMQHDNLSFIDAVEQLAAQAGMQVPKSSPQERQKAKEQKDLYTLMDETARYFSDQLAAPANKTALDYVLGRGIDKKTIGAFRIGYAPSDFSSLREHLKKKGYTDKQMIEAGVVRPSKQGKDPYAFFRDRIMFPVADRRGRIVAFGGRILPEDLRPPERGDYKPAKYMNSSDTPIFNKSRILYGEPYARQAVTDGSPVLVVEGYMDVIACAQAGFHGGVAPMGTALTDDQILRLWKLIPSDEKVPILCFDGDNAGQRAAFRASENILPLLKPNHSARFAFLPQGQDPDSLIKENGAQAFQTILDDALPLSKFLWQHYSASHDLTTPEGRAGLEAKLNEQADRIQDRTVQTYYRRAFKDMLFKAFRYNKPAGSSKNSQGYSGQKYGSSNRSGYGNRGGFPVPSPVQINRPNIQKENIWSAILLLCLINHPRLIDDIGEGFYLISFENSRLDDVRQSLLSFIDSKIDSEDELDSALVKDYLIEEGYKTELDFIMSSAVYQHARYAQPDADYNDVMLLWRETMKSLFESKNLRDEIQNVHNDLLKDFSKENEERLIALQNVKNNTK